MSESARQMLYSLPGFHDPFSAISHLLGAVVFLVLGARLLRRGQGSRSRLAHLAVYAVACVFLFSMSGVYHMTAVGGAARAVMARLDHAAIFVLIAATFTPIHGLLFRGWLRWGPLGFIWTTAIVAIVVKTVYFDSFPDALGLSLYLVLGWLGSVTAVLVARTRGLAAIAPLLWGGLAYSLGAVAEFVGRPVLLPGVIRAHEIFHLAVLAGALLHFSFIWRIAGEDSARRRPLGATAAVDDERRIGYPWRHGDRSDASGQLLRDDGDRHDMTN